jgi:UDP-N-acetylmuramoyl-L-alanyl-D-glutamate--2,6-diaminopimelate ligase
MKLLSQLLKKNEYTELFVNGEPEITSIQHDSRKCTDGSLFVAIPGEVFDGHDFIAKAIENGAIAIVCERLPKDVHSDKINYIKVKNCRKSLAIMAHRWYDDPSKNMQIIGVTGTNGKTTVTYILKSIFEQAGRRCGIIGTTGIIVHDETLPATHTTPESLELAAHLAYMRNQNIDICIMEVSSHALVQDRVSAINFSAALFTNLTHEHLDYHKTIEEYAAAKKILFDDLDENSIAIAHNLSEESSYILSDCKAKKKYFIGRDNDPDIQILNERMHLDRSEFDLIFSNKSIHLSTNLIGKFNIENVGLAASLAMVMGLDDNAIKSGVANTKGAPGRMQRIPLSNGAVGIVDYAHTPDALEKALLACREVLNSEQNAGKLICVFGCGGDRDKAKRPKMGNISSRLADMTIITTDNPRTEDLLQIIKDITIGIDNNKIYDMVLGRREAIKTAYIRSKRGDLILIAGKGHETYQIIGTERTHFDDSEELRRIQ